MLKRVIIAAVVTGVAMLGAAGVAYAAPNHAESEI